MGEVEFVADVSNLGSIKGEGKEGETRGCNVGMDLIPRGDC